VENAKVTVEQQWNSEQIKEVENELNTLKEQLELAIQDKQTQEFVLKRLTKQNDDLRNSNVNRETLMKVAQKEAETMRVEKNSHEKQLKKELQESKQKYESLYAQSEELLKPEQLEEMKEINDLLQQEKEMTMEELKKLAEENAKLIGHTNVKQRISYHYKVKGENIQLKQDKLVLQDKLQKATTEIKSLKDQLGGILPSKDKSQNNLTTKDKTQMNKVGGRTKVPLQVTNTNIQHM